MTTISGVESARRRRVSHAGRSAAALQPHVRFTQPPASRTNMEGNDPATAARHRLDEKLHTIVHARSNRQSRTASCATCPVAIQGRFSALNMALARSSGADSGSQTQASYYSSTAHERIKAERDGISCREFGKMIREERAVELIGTSVQPAEADCAVCLESIVGGQMVIYLACGHRFHSTCLVPWLLDHCHCPCCRAHVANPQKN